MDPKNVAGIPSGSLHEEYGNALSQDIKTVSPSDSDVIDVIKYVQQYARERYPWSIPRSSSQGPDPLVTKLSKKILIYTHDGEIPLYYDDVVQDRFDNEQGKTRFIALGTVYDFVLTWTESMIKFCHTFTVSVYPKDRINIYTHTYFLQNLNISNPNIGQSQYLFPKIESGSSSDHTGQFTYIAEFPYSDTDKGSFHKAYTDKPDSCSGKLEGGDGDKVLFTDKAGEYRLVKVMTYNIWNMNSKSTRVGGYTERMKRLKETILKADPDIIALQEVRFEEAKGEDLGPSQIHTLSEWLPQYQYVFQPAQMQSSTVNDGRAEEGVAIMSKYPVISYNSIMLYINRSNGADGHQRVLLQANIFIPSVGMVHVFNTHLSLSHEAREKSVVQIWKHVKLQKGPVIVLGDLNAEPHEPAMQYLSGNSVVPGEDRSQLIDAWSASNTGDNGLTFSALDKNFTKRIDYIFFRQGEQYCSIESCNVIDDGSRGNEAASDHLPVMVVLSMKTKGKHSTDSWSLHEEYGNALRQDIKTVSPIDSDVIDVIKYVQQYARKRYPWSIPRSSSQVTQLSKKILIYAHDGEIPLYYDDVVQDRFDNEDGISRFIALGTVYHFVLTWTESMIKFCHTFTVSVYPKDRINIYTHTYFLQNLNISNPNIGQSQYLFPKIESGSFHKAYTNKPDSCSGQLEGGDDKVLFTDKAGEYRLVKVMTYNIWHMNSKSTRVGGYTERMKRLKETILKADPDIIALQEVRFEEANGEDLGPSQIHTLSEWLPQYQYVFQPAQMQSSTVNDGRAEEGVAIMSKYPVISYNSIMLYINRSNGADTHQRVLLQADICIPSVGMVHIFNTHLSLSHQAREKSVVQIWKRVKLQKGPVIVLGDLNAEPHESAMQYLSGNSVFPGEDRSQLIDAWSASSPGDKGLTFSLMHKNFTKRIDYIFFRQGEQCCSIESCNVIDDGSRGSEAASHHLPVMVVLSMKTKGKHSIDSS